MGKRLTRFNCGSTEPCRCIPRPMTSAMPMANTSREMVKELRITKQVATLDSATMCWEFFGEEHRWTRLCSSY